THTYTETGMFTVQVRIFDEAGASAETFSTATVGAAGAPQGPRGGSAGSLSNGLLLKANEVQVTGRQLQGGTLTGNANAVSTSVQASPSVQFGRLIAEDLYWQRLGRAEDFIDSNHSAADQLVLMDRQGL